MDARLHRIRAECGKLCNTRRPTYGTSERARSLNHSAVHRMPCTWLLADNTGIDAVREQREPPVVPPAQWLDDFTMHGRFPLSTGRFGDESAQGVEMNNSIPSRQGNAPLPGWSKAEIGTLVVCHSQGTEPKPLHPVVLALWSS